MAGHVYILASRYRGSLYVGVTADLPRRMWEHREGHGSNYCRGHGIARLVWSSEPIADIRDAIAHEKRLKRWPRAWKFNLVEAENPEWLDLYETLNC